MGSKEKEEMSNKVDCGVGSIVWVRRRNGSWWPGKILGPAELSAANLVSPRSGTPVKLLGREDASVDWYNLEKSKRVKPFRCGEFDECIERAESAFGMPPKKREKYARREDAILHALELEKQLLDDKYGNLDSPIDGRRNKSSVMVKKEPAVSSKCSKYNKKFMPRSKNLVIATKHEEVNDPICALEVNKLSHMKGSLNVKSELDNFGSDFSISGLINDKATSIRGSLEKKRRLTSVNEPLVKRRDRRRSVVQVLQKSEKEQKEPTSRSKMSDFYLPSESNDCSDEDKLIGLTPRVDSSFDMGVDGFSHPTEMDEESSPDESTENTETDSSKTQSDEDADMAGLAEAAFVPKLEAKPQEISEQFRRRSLSIELPNDSDMPPFYLNNHGPASLGASKWQIKGKRNKRRNTKRSTETTDRWVARGFMYTTTDLEEVESDGFDGNVERGFRTQTRPYCNQRSLYNRNIINEQPWMRGYWEDSRDHLNCTFDTQRSGERMEIGLLDVDLNVQSSYQRGEHVPLISLRSKLNGKAIVGHPIQVEILENGSTNSLLSSSNGWKMPFKKSKNDISDGIISKLPSKKVGLSSYQKIKNLSAIEREQRFGNNFRSGDTSSFRAGGLIKGEVGPTAVACIPVKLVFCRLNEGLVGRHQ